MILGLAPMDGVTNLPYRTIVERIFAIYNKNPDQTLWTWTEFMNADGYMVQPHRLSHHFIHQDTESNLIIQIYGGTKETLVAAAIDIDKKYHQTISGIELNIGCPSPRVMSGGGGSALMKDHEYLTSIVHEISESIQSPFSIKVRSGLRNDNKQERFDTLVSLSSFCKIITVHGRTFSMGHSGENDREYIRKLKQEVDQECTIIANGGIKTYQEMPQTKTLDGYMIGQAAIGNPRVFASHEPTPQDRYDIILEHMHLLLAYEYRKSQNIPEDYEDQATRHNKTLLHARKKGGDIGDDTRHQATSIQHHKFIMKMPTIAELNNIAENISKYVNLDTDHQGLVEFRKYLFNYIAGLPGSKDLKKSLARSKQYNEIKEAIDDYFSSLDVTLYSTTK